MIQVPFTTQVGDDDLNLVSAEGPGGTQTPRCSLLLHLAQRESTMKRDLSA